MQTLVRSVVPVVLSSGNNTLVVYMEKPLNFDPFGHAELSLLAKI